MKTKQQQNHLDAYIFSIARADNVAELQALIRDIQTDASLTATDQETLCGMACVKWSSLNPNIPLTSKAKVNRRGIILCVNSDELNRWMAVNHTTKAGAEAVVQFWQQLHFQFQCFGLN